MKGGAVYACIIHFYSFQAANLDIFGILDILGILLCISCKGMVDLGK